jgi:hypothetical protein
MNWVIASRRGVAARLLGALAALIAATAGAHAQGRLGAQYSIIMTGVTIGHVTWSVDIGTDSYTTAASGKASGMLSMLVNGEGSVGAAGRVENWHLRPVEFNSQIIDEDGNTRLHVGFVDGMAAVTATPPLAPTPERLPVTAADRRGVADPLSAVLITARPGESYFSADNCDHLLSIFDGRRRYDLELSFLRVDKVALKQSYAGPVLVCRMMLRPIAGYRPDSLLVKYVAGRRDMELWLAPIAGTALMAPIRVAMPTMIGTLKIEADKFDTTALPRPADNPAMPAH